MEALILEGTSYTPEVIFDVEKGQFTVSGDSRPEDTFSFYDQLIQWLSQLKGNTSVRGKLNGGSDFKFQFDYLNSSSSKFILKILLLIKELNDEGYDFKIHWMFDEPDIDMKELGEEYTEMTGLDINLVEVEI